MPFPHIMTWRSIPARAGEPATGSTSGTGNGVYPRACGGTSLTLRRAPFARGLSPRVRRNRQDAADGNGKVGSIPARAGEPAVKSSRTIAARVYPRACGGTRTPCQPRIRLPGLSPRVRGNQCPPEVGQHPIGSIPARAGEPQSQWGPACLASVYPRACGGTLRNRRPALHWSGLSPRVRGNHAGRVPSRWRKRSIPARAGEPQRWLARGSWRTVYPRACGGTTANSGGWPGIAGLSPRVRGNQARRVRGEAAYRSIPARAGEPASVALTSALKKVYPRACGGTGVKHPIHVPMMGLSPRVRGNLVHSDYIFSNWWSIPARAGEPQRSGAGFSLQEVYPRACGGTGAPPMPVAHHDGLSPRVRGNLVQLSSIQGQWRSIPARAGEPGQDDFGHDSAQVYPRACGGTAYHVPLLVVPLGLSPRVRGNRIPCPLAGRPIGSIPARAGEPHTTSPCWSSHWVYPRACGGTYRNTGLGAGRQGLSPRVRGNRGILAPIITDMGSIPARAGEPSLR